MLTSARKSLACASLLLVSACLLAQSPATKRDPRIGSVLDNLGKARSLYQTAISPDGKLLAWVVRGEEGGKRSGTEIEVAPLADPEKTTRATAGTKGALCEEGDIAWSPDSKTLAFLSDCQADGDGHSSDKGGQRDFYLYQPGGKSAPRRLTHLHGIADEPAFSPDGKQLGFLYVEGATRFASPLAAEKPPAGVIGEDGLEIKRVASAQIADGKVNQITPANLYAYEFDWSPDSQQLAYIAAPPPGENNWWVAKLYTQHLSSDVPTTILDPVSTPGPLHGLQIAVPRWSPDGKQIAFIGGLMSDQGATGGDIYVIPSGGGNSINLGARAATYDSTAIWFEWLSNVPAGDGHYAENTWLISKIQGGSSRIARYTSTGPISCAGKSSTVPCSDGSYSVEEKEPILSAAASLGDGRLEGSISLASGDAAVAYIHSSFQHAPEVYAGPLGKAIQITHYNDALKPAWGKSESITWTSPVQPSPTISASQPDSPKDFHVQGWLLYPADYDPAKKYPLIVYVHGGPSSATLPHWPRAGFGPAPFAALGYFVLMPNPRGSYGQGEAFTQANRKDFGYGDLRDILAGVDAVTKSHSIDPERVGLTGWSYGGFMTMFAVTQTNRFRAAVAGAGISNWQSYYGENAIDQWMIPFFGASVYDDPGVYAKMSAVNFIKNVKTPTLAVVGDRDGECPAPQSFEFWHALKAQHVPTQLVVYPNEGHGFTDPEHQRDVIARALDWFQKYMPAN
jgi:dipeptidyl aminopeptidase/acylaminoacyl peptidase